MEHVRFLNWVVTFEQRALSRLKLENLEIQLFLIEYGLLVRLVGATVSLFYVTEGPRFD